MKQYRDAYVAETRRICGGNATHMRRKRDAYVAELRHGRGVMTIGFTFNHPSF